MRLCGSFGILELALPRLGLWIVFRHGLMIFREELKRINIPVLVMHGDADRILPILPQESELRNLSGGPNSLLLRALRMA